MRRAPLLVLIALRTCACFAPRCACSKSHSRPGRLLLNAQLDEEAPLQILAKHALAMLSSSEANRDALMEHAESNRQIVSDLMNDFGVSETGLLKAPEAEMLFKQIAQGLLREAAGSGQGAASIHAQRLLAAEESGDSSTIDEMADHLLRIADLDGDGNISLHELSELFEGDGLLGSNEEVMAQLVDRPGTLELYKLRGSLQLLPRIARHFDSDALVGESWHESVAGDSHTMMRWVAPTHARDGLSIVGLGRSADASCYYLPEWGLVLDAGLATKAFTPKTVLLSHGHRDHTQALPVLARPAPFGRAGQVVHPPMVLLPEPLVPLVENYMHAESVLNFGHAQSIADNVKALGKLDLRGVRDGDVIALPRHAYSGKRALSVEVFAAPHKDMPAVAFGIFRTGKKLKPEYAAQQARIPELMRANPGLEVSEAVKEPTLFYSGDTTIGLLEARSSEILAYRYIIHECTFLGEPTAELDEYARKRGHTHYAQLHRYICAAPNTVWVLVHWSVRYSRQDVEDFFEDKYGGVPRNVVLWIK